jgi:hypothetical protein
MNNFQGAGQHVMEREVHKDLSPQSQKRTGDFSIYDKELCENCDVIFGGHGYEWPSISTKMVFF